MRNKIAILSICSVFAFYWVGFSVSPFIKYITEKNKTEKKATFPQSEMDLEEKLFEVVYNLSPTFTSPIDLTIVADGLFSKNINFPESLTLDSSKPPPKLIC